MFGTTQVSADFDVAFRDKSRIATREGWESETVYDFSLDGTIRVEVPGLSRALPMDGCLADAQIGMGKSS